jgi:WD40 repeat protein
MAPNGRSRITAWTNGKVEWQGTSRDELRDLSSYRISTVLFSPNSQIFFSGCRDGIVRVWDASTCQMLFQLKGHLSGVRALALSPEGSCLATADQQGLVLLWSFGNQSHVRKLTKLSSPVNSLSFSDDGLSLALGTGNSYSAESAEVQVWDVVTDRLRACLPHESALAIVRLSPDGKSVSGTEWNGTLLTWDLESSTLISRRQINCQTIPPATFAPQS